jgi:uncharacterized damage-inducible protein DinB
MGESALEKNPPTFAVAFRDFILEAMADELGSTAKLLAAIPDARRDYRPDNKSRSAWELAWHIAADVWFLEGIAERHFELNPDQIHANPCSTAAELAEWYTARNRQAHERIRSIPATELAAPLTLGGVAESTGITLPAFHYLFWVHLHTVHHRGQLTAYLRPMGAKVPGVYGASADEKGG